MRFCSLGVTPVPRGLFRFLFRGEALQQSSDELLRVGGGLLLPGQQPLREDLVGRAEKDADGEPRVEILAELAAGDAVAQDVAEEAEVLDELAARKALDEPRAPAELDLKDGREVAVRPDELEVEVEE